MNLNFVCLFYYLIVCIISGTLGRTSRIIGGVPANIRDFPYLVSFRTIDNNIHFCAGSIISNYYVISAGHCFFAFDNEFDNIRVYSGKSSSVDTSGPSYTIRYIIFYAEFSGELTFEILTANDIALIKLKEYIEFNEFQNKISLPSRDIFYGNIGVVVGWGVTTYPNGILSEYLQQASVNIYNEFECINRVPENIHANQLCAFTAVGVGTCAGDSGGPVVSNNELFGIISYSFKCADGVPDVHTRVYAYLDFIRRHVRD